MTPSSHELTSTQAGPQDAHTLESPHPIELYVESNSGLITVIATDVSRTYGAPADRQDHLEIRATTASGDISLQQITLQQR